MRIPSSMAVVAFIGLAAGCSRGKPAESDQLDLVLGDGGQRPRVVSAIEIAGEAKATPVSVAQSGAVAPLHARRQARNRRPAPRPRPAPEAEHVPAPARAPQPTIATAPAPEPSHEPAPDPAPTSAPDPQPGHGRGDWPAPTGGGIHIPGIGGVIIIRGGHSGTDPCDEHGRHGGIGGGIFPGLPGRIGRGSPGGIIFLRGR